MLGHVLGATSTALVDTGCERVNRGNVMAIVSISSSLLLMVVGTFNGIELSIGGLHMTVIVVSSNIGTVIGCDTVFKDDRRITGADKVFGWFDDVAIKCVVELGTIGVILVCGGTKLACV